MDKADVYYVSAICWSESNNEEIVNNASLEKTKYIEVPSCLTKEEDVHKFVEYQLYTSTLVTPWYYNLEKVV